MPSKGNTLVIITYLIPCLPSTHVGVGVSVKEAPKHFASGLSDRAVNQEVPGEPHLVSAKSHSLSAPPPSAT